MKVTLYIDGEHNTVEVKDKIKSVFPDAKYMIFHPADNVSKVTEFDRIKNMSVQEMADFLENTNTVTGIKLNGKYFIREKSYIKQWLETEVKE